MLTPKVLAIVPARSGSKGLPGKNVLPLLGKPLLAWSIEDGLQCEQITDVILSTDSIEYAEIGRSFGAQVPFLRPHDLSDDQATSVDVVLHALLEMEKVGKSYDIVILLEPTSPLRSIKDIEKAIELISSRKALAAAGICLAETIHPAFMFTRSENELISPLCGRYPNALRRQDIEPIYFLEGSIYASDVSYFKKVKCFYHQFTSGVVVPFSRSSEIDSLTDFFFVESLLTNKPAIKSIDS